MSLTSSGDGEGHHLSRLLLDSPGVSHTRPPAMFNFHSVGEGPELIIVRQSDHLEMIVVDWIISSILRPVLIFGSLEIDSSPVPVFWIREVSKSG